MNHGGAYLTLYYSLEREKNGLLDRLRQSKILDAAFFTELYIYTFLLYYIV